MTRALTRTNFHSSRLVRVFADLAILDTVEPGVAFAEKLGLWVNYTNAITLSAALNAHPTSPSGKQTGTKSVASAAVSEEFARMRATLVNSIMKSCSSDVDGTGIERPSTELGVTIEIVTAYEPYRRYYLAQQRDMELTVRAWRSKVRSVLGKASPALQQLAALDAALDAILGTRESKLFSTVPALLEKRFAQLLMAHQQRLVDSNLADHPDFWMKPGGWLARFCHELQTVLLAELDVRLQPTVGLLEALHNEKTNLP